MEKLIPNITDKSRKIQLLTGIVTLGIKVVNVERSLQVSDNRYSLYDILLQTRTEIEEKFPSTNIVWFSQWELTQDFQEKLAPGQSLSWKFQRSLNRLQTDTYTM